MSGRVAVLGLARSGRAAALLALKQGAEVYASDAGDTPVLREAAEAVRAAGGRVDLGSHDIDAIAGSDVLVVSPGIPPTAPVLQDERVAAVPQISELEYAARALRSKVVAVTGTNGKTTVTALTAHLLRASGVDAVAAGNIGRALADVAVADEHPAVTVVEASSFQLAGVDRFRPDVGVLTNLAPDHLDRYASVAEYYGDKARMFDNAEAGSRWVLNGEDVEVERLIGDAPGERYPFHLEHAPAGDAAGAWLDGDLLRVRLERGGEPVDLVRTDELRLLGRHNAANALAASLAALLAGATVDGVRAGLRDFAPMEHRLEPVAERDGVLWVNDSKATNLDSTRMALRSMERPVVLLLGGRHKGEPYTGLLEAAQGRVRVVVAYGEAAPVVVRDLESHLTVVRVDGGFERVVATAAGLARPGDAVLLSPACSSYDMFENYEQRGARFRELARAVPAREPGVRDGGASWRSGDRRPGVSNGA
mgnify:CR=1 FL=1